MNGKRWYAVSGVAIVFILGVYLASCSGGGGGGSAVPSAKFKVILKDLTTAGVSLKPMGKVFSAPSNTIGEAGSTMDSMLGQLETFELQKSDDSWVTVYSSSGYVEFVGTANKSVTDSIISALPPAGTYKAYRMTMTGVKIKMMLVQGGTPYYTTLQTVSGASPQPWVFSTNAADYDYVTYDFSAPSVFESVFPTPLTVTDTSITLYYVTKRAGTVSCDGNEVNVDITYCSQDDISEGLLPAAPLSMMQFVVSATTSSTTPLTRTNTITAYFGDQNNFLGATVFRPADWYFNGSNMITGSGLFSGATLTGSLDLTFMDGDGIADGTYSLKADFDCNADLFSGLTITAAGPGVSMDTGNYTLNATGAVTCSAI